MINSKKKKGKALKKISVAVLLLILVIAGGTFGYVIIERWKLLESLYMTIITMSTVGFREAAPLSDAGKIFTIALIASSVGIFAYSVTAIGNFIIEGQFGFISRRRKMEKNISSLKNHYIICGCSKVAQEVITEFKKTNTQFVVVAKETEEALGDLLNNIIYYLGDPTSDDALKKVRIEEAKGLVSCLDADTDNLFVVLSAHNLNDKLNIVSIAKEETTKNKLLKAGANNVILPEVIGGKRMASMILRPRVLSFLDVMTTPTQEEVSLRLEELLVHKNRTLVNNSLKKAKIPQKTGLLVVAIKKKKGGFLYNPSSSTIIEAEDTLIVLGKDEQIQRLREILRT